MSKGGFSEVKVPFAAFHSANDNLTDIEGTEALMSGSNPRNGDKVFYRVGEGLDINVRYVLLRLCVRLLYFFAYHVLLSFLCCAILYCVDFYGYLIVCISFVDVLSYMRIDHILFPFASQLSPVSRACLSSKIKDQDVAQFVGRTGVLASD